MPHWPSRKNWDRRATSAAGGEGARGARAGADPARLKSLQEKKAGTRVSRGAPCGKTRREGATGGCPAGGAARGGPRGERGEKGLGGAGEVVVVSGEAVGHCRSVGGTEKW